MADLSLQPDNPVVIARGKTVYEKNCAACHGKNLEGEPDWRSHDKDGYLPAPPHDETGHSWHHSDRKLFDITKYGFGKVGGQDYKTRMPIYRDLLSDGDIIAVLSYIKSRWPARIRKRHDQINAAARRAAD